MIVSVAVTAVAAFSIVYRKSGMQDNPAALSELFTASCEFAQLW
jgi:hypothetical protein